MVMQQAREAKKQLTPLKPASNVKRNPKDIQTTPENKNEEMDI